jgi:hypothetical protein
MNIGPLRTHKNIELMLILSSQTVLFQHPFERGHTHLYAKKKNRFAKIILTFLLLKKLSDRKVKSQNSHCVLREN